MATPSSLLPEPSPALEEEGRDPRGVGFRDDLDGGVTSGRLPVAEGSDAGEGAPSEARPQPPVLPDGGVCEAAPFKSALRPQPPATAAAAAGLA